jgi:hypothetical protein
MKVSRSSATRLPGTVSIGFSLASRKGRIFRIPPGDGTVVKPFTARIDSKTRYASSAVTGSGEITVTRPRTRSSYRKFLPVALAIVLITSVMSASWKSRVTRT